VNILLLSSGGGGGNIVRSLKSMFRRDLTVTQKSDPKYAERLRRAVTTRFLDTNEFSLLDLPKEERFLVGAATTRRLGSMHNPELAGAALEESKHDVESLFARFTVIVLIATGGKGTGAGTIFPLARMAREQRKLVIPIFVRPSFERHEVEKQRYDHALKVTEQFDAARIRLVEILNDRGYVDTDPQPQSAVWERMNRPIAGGLRGLLYVLSDLSQVDPSDLSVMFAGNGRLRIGFSEIAPTGDHDPTDEQVHDAVRHCWDNSYYAFGERVGTSLICVQGDWSNVVDSKIKGRFAALAHSEAGNAAYNPLYARAPHVPRPWGVTAILAEHTGTHPPLDVEWSVERRVSAPVNPPPGESLVASLAAAATEVVPSPEVVPLAATVRPAPPFGNLWEFALALNRSDPTAVALASDGAECSMPLEVTDVRKLLSTYWVRSLFPRLSASWRERILETLLQKVTMPDHAVTNGRHTARVSELTHEELKRIMTETMFPVAIRRDLQLLVAVGTLWGEETARRFEFTPVSGEAQKPSRLGSLLEAFRGTSTSESPSEHRQ